ncbi:MAG: hypothetical protein ACWGNK_13545, partial [Desulfobacterales bacterium]
MEVLVFFPILIGSRFRVQPRRWPQATSLIEKETVPLWRSFIRGFKDGLNPSTLMSLSDNPLALDLE